MIPDFVPLPFVSLVVHVVVLLLCISVGFLRALSILVVLQLLCQTFGIVEVRGLNDNYVPLN